MNETMTTIEKIKEHAEEIIGRLKAGSVMTSEDKKVMKIYSSITGGNAGNAGKRKREKGTLPPQNITL